MTKICGICKKTFSDPAGTAHQCPRCGSVFLTASVDAEASVQETVDLPNLAFPDPIDDGANERYRIEVRRRSIVREGDGSDPLAEYVVRELIGEGGMGEVYLARQTSIDREIALKMVRARFVGDPAVREKFLAEVAVTSDLDHPNIVPIHDVGVSDDGQLFYSMKRVRGTPWHKVMRTRTREQNLDALLHVCDAVAFAHSRGVIHRDLKPENVMLGDYGEVYVMDWGMAVSATDTGRATPLADVRTIAGTPAYMAPEMAAGRHTELGFYSDVYLLGAILYEIITGDCPHVGTTLEETLDAARANTIRRPATGGELAEIALKAMSTNPAGRYPNVRDFQEAIRLYRAHAQSLFLASRAQEDFRQAQKSRSYDHFNQALYGFREALVLWDGNGFARDQLSEVSLAYAKCAYQKSDYDLSLSLLNADDPRATELATTVSSARAARERRDRAFRLFKLGVVALACLVCFVILISTLVLKDAQEKTDLLRQHVDIQQQRAIKAEQGQQELKQQREDIWQPVVAYDFATLPQEAPDFRSVLIDAMTTPPTVTPAPDAMTLENGVLRILRTPDRKRAQLVWRQAVPEETRVEVTVLNSSDEGPNLDISISGDVVSGYRLRVYGYGHIQFETESGRNWERLYRCPVELDPNAKEYAFALWRTGNTFIAQVNGAEVMRLDDPLALRGRRHRTFSVGRYGELGSCDITALRVFRRQDPQFVSVLEPGKVLLRMNYVRDAREWFERMIVERSEPEIVGEARYLLATIARTTPEKIAQLMPISADETNPFRINALRDLAYMQYAEGSLDRALEALEALSQLRPDDPTPQHFFGIVRPRIAESVDAARLDLCSRLAHLRIKTLELDALGLDTLEPFAGMTSVRFLDMTGNPVTSLAPLSGLTNLKTLYCRQTAIESLAPLRGLPLEVLDLSDTPVTDLSPLRGMKLRTLIFSAERITAGWDALRGMESLQFIDGTGKRNTKQTPAQFWAWHEASSPRPAASIRAPAGSEAAQPVPAVPAGPAVPAAPVVPAGPADPAEPAATGSTGATIPAAKEPAPAIAPQPPAP